MKNLMKKYNLTERDLKKYLSNEELLEMMDEKEPVDPKAERENQKLQKLKKNNRKKELDNEKQKGQQLDNEEDELELEEDFLKYATEEELEFLLEATYDDVDNAIALMRKNPEYITTLAQALGVEVSAINLDLNRMQLVSSLQKITGKSATDIVNAFATIKAPKMSEAPAGGRVKPTLKKGKGYRF